MSLLMIESDWEWVQWTVERREDELLCEVEREPRRQRPEVAMGLGVSPSMGSVL